MSYPEEEAPKPVDAQGPKSATGKYPSRTLMVSKNGKEGETCAKDQNPTTQTQNGKAASAGEPTEAGTARDFSETYKGGILAHHAQPYSVWLEFAEAYAASLQPQVTGLREKFEEWARWEDSMDPDAAQSQLHRYQGDYSDVLNRYYNIYWEVAWKAYQAGAHAPATPEEKG